LRGGSENLAHCSSVAIVSIVWSVQIGACESLRQAEYFTEITLPTSKLRADIFPRRPSLRRVKFILPARCRAVQTQAEFAEHAAKQRRDSKSGSTQTVCLSHVVSNK
ncbi:MAG: hypothetical protein ACK5Z0_06695, partial [Planctomycetota bacterium]